MCLGFVNTSFFRIGGFDIGRRRTIGGADKCVCVCVSEFDSRLQCGVVCVSAKLNLLF